MNVDIPVAEESEDLSPIDENDTIASLASTARDLRIEHGRTYSGRGTDPIPNDELNTENEAFAHDLFLKLLNNQLYIAPIAQPRRVLDLGCGTGLWSLDMADRHPEAQILGLDINPNDRFTPPNCELRIEDIRGEWMPDNRDFDLVHMRLLYSFDVGDWQHLYQEIYRNLIPNGYVEHAEVQLHPKDVDGSMRRDSVFKRVAEITRQFTEELGKNFNITDTMRGLMTGAGFVDITERRYIMPVSEWSSDPYWQTVGAATALYAKTGIQGWLLRLLTTHYNWTRAQVDALAQELIDAVNAKREHVYYEVVIMYARKPSES